MTRRRKDPLRPFTDAERRELTRLRQSPTAPAAVVIRGFRCCCWSAAGRATRVLLARSVARVATPSPTWSRSSTRRPGGARTSARRRPGWGLRRGGPRPHPAGGGAEADPEQDGTATWSLSTLRRAAVGRRWLYRASRPSPYGGSCTRPGTATSRPAPGVPPAQLSANARPVSSPSPIPTLGQKKADRGRLPAGRSVGPAGLVLRPGGPLPDRPPPRPELATGGATGRPAARVRPQRDGQGADPVPPGRRAEIARRGTWHAGVL